MSTRDDLLKVALSSSEFKTKKVKVKGAEFEVRETSRKVRKDLLEKCTDENGKVNTSDFLVWSIIYCTFDPGTGARVFDDEHYDSIMESPTSGVLAKLEEAAAELMNVDGDISDKVKK